LSILGDTGLAGFLINSEKYSKNHNIENMILRYNMKADSQNATPFEN